VKSVRHVVLAIVVMLLAACAAPTYRVATRMPAQIVDHPVHVSDARPDASRQRRALHDAEGRDLPAQILGDADIVPGKLDLLAHYVGMERRADEPDELRVTRLDVTLWYPTASGGGFSVGTVGSHGFASVGGYSPQPILGDAIVLSLRADYGGRHLEVELREPLAQGVTRYTREPNRPEEVRPAFERAARSLLDQYRQIEAETQRRDEPAP
jgi:hypothetical protein